MRQLSLVALFDYKQYKGLLAVFNEESRNLSPVFGALACTSDFLKNIYKWAPRRWPTHELVHQLFNVSEESYQLKSFFELNRDKFDLIQSLDGEFIGKIVVWLKSGQLEDTFKKLVAEMRNKHAIFLSERKRSVYAISENDAEDFLELIVKSYNFDSKVTLMMLTALLYLKQDIKKNEMIAYVKALCEGLGDIIFVEPLTEALKVKLLGQIYTQKELKEKNTLESKIIATMSGEDQGSIAPAVLMGIDEFKGERKTDGIEVALNDWLNLLVYSFDDNDFTLEVVPFNVRRFLSSDFKNFYMTYVLEDVNSKEAGEAFRAMISSVKKVDEYFKDKDFEIESVSRYMLEVISRLLGLDQIYEFEELPELSWQELCNLLSTDRRSIKRNKLDSLNELEFEFNDNGNILIFSLKIKDKKCLILKCNMGENVKQSNYLHDSIGIENRHYFFTYNIKNRKVGSSVLSEVVSLDVRLDILFNSLLHPNYCGEDMILKKKLFENAIGFSEMMNLFNEQEVSDMISQSLLFLDSEGKEVFESNAKHLLMVAEEDVSLKDVNIKNYRPLFIDKYSKTLSKYFFIMPEVSVKLTSELLLKK